MLRIAEVLPRKTNCFDAVLTGEIRSICFSNELSAGLAPSAVAEDAILPFLRQKTKIQLPAHVHLMELVERELAVRSFGQPCKLGLICRGDVRF